MRPIILQDFMHRMKKESLENSQVDNHRKKENAGNMKAKSRNLIQFKER